MLFTFSLFGQSGNALHFDGQNDFITLNNPPFYQGSFTVEGWIKPQQSGVIFHVRDRVNDLLTAVYVEVMTNGKIRFFIRNKPSNTGGAFVLGTTDVLTDSNWHHFAAVKGEDDKLRLYVDGELDGTSRGIIRDFDAANFDVLLGVNVRTSPRYYHGMMDEVRFWNQERMDTEIKNDMNQELVGNESGLVAYFQFNEGTPGGDNANISKVVAKTGSHEGTLENFALTGSASNFVGGDPIGNIALIGGHVTIGGQAAIFSPFNEQLPIFMKSNGCNIVYDDDGIPDMQTLEKTDVAIIATLIASWTDASYIDPNKSALIDWINAGGILISHYPGGLELLKDAGFYSPYSGSSVGQDWVSTSTDYSISFADNPIGNGLSGDGVDNPITRNGRFGYLESSVEIATGQTVYATVVTGDNDYSKACITGKDIGNGFILSVRFGLYNLPDPEGNQILLNAVKTLLQK